VCACGTEVCALTQLTYAYGRRTKKLEREKERRAGEGEFDEKKHKTRK
jgi:hypothetical protein